VARSALAERLRSEQRAELAERSAGQRVALALELGERALALYCAVSGLTRAEARRLLERRAQTRRRRSDCHRALVG
jgi:hypothetical protein